MPFASPARHDRLIKTVLLYLNIWRLCERLFSFHTKLVLATGIPNKCASGISHYHLTYSNDHMPWQVTEAED